MATYTVAHTLSTLGFALSTVGTVWLLGVIARIIYNVFFHPLRNFPGPKWWAATSIPATIAQVSGKEVYTLLDHHEKYGPVVRTAPNELSYADPVVWRDAFAHRQGHGEFGKSSRTAVVPPNGVLGILFANRENHSRYRRAFSSSFSDRGMQKQQPLIKGYVDLFIQGLKQRSVEGPQDMTAWFNWTTFDIIGHLTFGESFGCLENQRMHPWIEAIFGNVKGVTFMGALKRVGLSWIIPYLVPKRAAALRLSNAQFAADRMRSRMEKGIGQSDFMDPVLQRHVGTQAGSLELNFDDLTSNASNIVLAGSETTASLLSGTVFQLLKHPEILQRTVQEIRGAFESVDEIDLFSTAKCEYMLAVLDETMRIYPPVPSQPTREAPPGGDTIDGKHIPAKTVIYVSQFIMNHLHRNFTKPFEFRPERFLQQRSQTVSNCANSEFANDNFAVFQPFSVGPRNCIGRNLAYSEMRLILGRLLFEFDLELDQRSESWSHAQKSYILWEKPALWVKLKPRAM